MKIRTSPANRAINQSGFTLIEMIGVLAVIAILAAVLIPKVFEAINNARVSNAAMTVNSVKTACVDHYAKYGSFPIDGSSGTPVTILPANIPVEQFDTILVKEGLMDKPFAVKIGDGIISAANTRVRLINAPAPPPAAATAVDGTDNGAYNLAGASPAVCDTTGTWLVEAIITGVTLADARALNAAIDGSASGLGEPAGGGDDLGGRVEYKAPASAGALITVHIYLTHR
jgi:prepilin-type N-terminal cleavage/methylation domain-containing protein